MENYNNYDLSKAERRQLRRIQRKKAVKAENVPELIALYNNGFLLWDLDAGTLALSESYKNHRYAARRRAIMSTFSAVTVAVIGGVILLLIELLL